MKLMTEELIKKFEKHPLGSSEKYLDSEIVVKYFNPCGPGTFLITEGERRGDDWLLFGYVDLGLGLGNSEFGYVSLKELESIKLPFGLSIERDLYAKGTIRDNLLLLGLGIPD